MGQLKIAIERRGGMKIINCVVLVLIFVFLFFPVDALAYIDVGSGSYLFQIFIAFFMAFLFTIKLYWRNILAFFSRKFSFRKIKK
jgi:hypothetical protein